MKRIVSVLSVGALVLSVFAPAAAASTNIEIAGNGAFSDNSVSVKQNNSTQVSQTNNSNIQNNVTSIAATGGNTSSFNTGGSSSIVTGDANSNVNISNKAGTNIATLPSCGCNNGDVNVSVMGNGAKSDNDVTVDSSNKMTLKQTNNTQITNNVESKALTGNNNTSFNTGPVMKDWNSWMNNWMWNGNMGSNFINTGTANSNVSIHNAAGLNVIH